MEGLSNVFARNCRIERIDSALASQFLSANHRLGATRARYRYGLFVGRTTGSAEHALAPGTLVAVALFSGPRRWTKGDRTVKSYEWVRYASLEGIRVVGGMGKLLQAFIDETGPDDVMSYADASAPDGGAVYRKLGFEQEKIVEGENYTNVKYRLKITPW